MEHLSSPLRISSPIFACDNSTSLKRNLIGASEKSVQKMKPIGHDYLYGDGGVEAKAKLLICRATTTQQLTATSIIFCRAFNKWYGPGISKIFCL